MGKKKKAKKAPIQKRNPNLTLNTKGVLFDDCVTKEDVMAKALILSDGRSQQEQIYIGATALDAIGRIIGQTLSDALTKGVADIHARHTEQELQTPPAKPLLDLQEERVKLDARLPK